MKKKLQTLFISFLLLGSLSLSSCGDDITEVYENNIINPGTGWDILNFTIDKNGGDDKGKWLWNSKLQQFECTFNISSEHINIDEFIYNNGISIGYVFLGEMGNDETQHILPFNQKQIKANLWYDTAIQGNDKDFTVRFYFQWDNMSNTPPPLYNFRLALVWDAGLFE